MQYIARGKELARVKKSNRNREREAREEEERHFFSFFLHLKFFFSLFYESLSPLSLSQASIAASVPTAETPATT